MSDIMTGNGWVQLEPQDYTIPNDVFQAVPIEVIQKENAKRANRFATAVLLWKNEKLEYVNVHDSFNEPPRTFFTNRTVPYVNPYEGYKGPVRKGIEV